MFLLISYKSPSNKRQLRTQDPLEFTKHEKQKVLGKR